MAQFINNTAGHCWRATLPKQQNHGRLLSLTSNRKVDRMCAMLDSSETPLGIAWNPSVQDSQAGTKGVFGQPCKVPFKHWMQGHEIRR